MDDSEVDPSQVDPSQVGPSQVGPSGLFEVLPALAFPLIWDHLDTSSKRHLFATSRGVRERCTSCVRAITLILRESPQEAEEQGKMKFLPDSAPQLLPYSKFRLSVKLQVMVEEDQMVGEGSLDDALTTFEGFLRGVEAGGRDGILRHVPNLCVEEVTLSADHWRAWMSALGEGQQLRRLVLDRAHVGHISGYFSSLTSLIHLQLTGCNFFWRNLHQDSMKYHWEFLLSLRPLQKLEVLVLEHVEFDFRGPIVPQLLGGFTALHTLKLRDAVFSEGGVEALPHYLPQLRTLAVRGLTPTKDLSSEGYPWTDLELREAHVADVGILPLACLGAGSGVQPHLRIKVLALGVESVETVTKAVENLLSCPGLPTKSVLHLERTFMADTMQPLALLQSRVAGVRLHDDHPFQSWMGEEILSGLHLAFGMMLKVLGGISIHLMEYLRTHEDCLPLVEQLEFNMDDIIPEVEALVGLCAARRSLRKVSLVWDPWWLLKDEVETKEPLWREALQGQVEVIVGSSACVGIDEPPDVW